MELKEVFSGGHMQTEFIKQYESIWLTILKEADKNNDGQLDFKEFENAMLTVCKDRKTK